MPKTAKTYIALVIISGAAVLLLAGIVALRRPPAVYDLPRARSAGLNAEGSNPRAGRNDVAQFRIPSAGNGVVPFFRGCRYQPSGSACSVLLGGHKASASGAGGLQRSNTHAEQRRSV